MTDLVKTAANDLVLVTLIILVNIPNSQNVSHEIYQKTLSENHVYSNPIQGLSLGVVSFPGQCKNGRCAHERNGSNSILQLK